MTRTRKTILSAVSFIIITSVYLFLYAIPSTDRTLKNEFATFNNANIEGVVEKVGTKHHTTSFRLNGIKHDFVIWDNINKDLNDNKTFRDVASKGDTITKRAKSDTLTIIHLGRAYRYTFRKL